MSYLTTVLADAPRHFWRCADPGGAILHDVGAVPLALAFATAYSTCGYSGPNSDGGSMISFTGQSAGIGDAEIVASPSSVEAWIWILSLAGAVNATVMDIETGGGGTIGLLRMTNDGKMHYFSWGGAPVSGVLTHDAWHHIVGTQDGVAATLYVDGVAQPAGAGAVSGNQAVLCALGARVNVTEPFRGMISEAAYYPVALTAARVAAHYAAADNIAGRPVFLGYGGSAYPGPSVPGSSPADATLASILASVRKTY
jgi:hypothetical protein